MTDLSNSDSVSVLPSVLQAAFDKTAADRAALKDEEIIQLNVDVPTAYQIVFGSLPEIRALRADIVNELVKFDVTLLTKVEDYACALLQAHRAFQTADAPTPGLAQLNDQAFALRDRFQSVAQMLAKLGVISASRLSEIKMITGYRNIAVDLANLTEIFRDAWPSIANKTPITMKEVADAENVAKQLLDAVALRDQSRPVLTRATDDRLRAFTLFARAYDEIRSAVIYVRRHKDDADKIAPSIYTGHGGRAKQKNEQPATPAAPAAPAPVSPTDATQPVATVPQGLGNPNESPFVQS
jgi:hypothetical protein